MKIPGIARRAISLLGLARAAAAAGDAALSRDAYGRLAAQWVHADADVPGRAEVMAAAKAK